jgi:aldose 1-epimerase
VAASGAQWTIQRGNQTAVVVEVGGGLRGYQVEADEYLDGYGEAEIAPGAAGQVLAPWPNRLRDGAFRFDGDSYQLPLTEPRHYNAIHGLVRWLPWRPAERADDSISVEVTLHPQPGYPWRLLLRTEYVLRDDGLAVRHTAENLSDRSAPFGLGAHPYLKIPGVAVNDLLLTVPARTRLLLDGRNLPIGAARVAATEYDFSQPRKLGSAVLDDGFGGLIRDEEGHSAVTLSASDGRSVRVWADSAFHWWQLYTGETLAGERKRRSIGIEPMTCPPDAFRSGRDLVVLQPEQIWTGGWGIGVEHGVR